MSQKSFLLYCPRCVLMLMAGAVISLQVTTALARQQLSYDTLVPSYSLSTDDTDTNTAAKPIVKGATIAAPAIHQIILYGEWQSGSTAGLLWKCTDKIPILFYELQRSQDSSKFVPLLLMHAKDAARNAAGYRFTDTAMPPGTCYYRLRIEDMDGKESYSQTITCFPHKADGLAQK